jgi:hypothetical protein
MAHGLLLAWDHKIAQKQAAALNLLPPKFQLMLLQKISVFSQREFGDGTTQKLSCQVVIQLPSAQITLMLRLMLKLLLMQDKSLSQLPKTFNLFWITSQMLEKATTLLMLMTPISGLNSGKLTQMSSMLCKRVWHASI